MKILVTGANGQLGRSIRVASRGTADSYVFTDVAGEDVAGLDITDAEAVAAFIGECRPDVIVNCAAYTDVNRAESEQQQAERLNADAAGNLARAAADCGAWLIHISTDYVFDGTGNRPLTEEDRTNPLSVYGQTKLEGERRVIESGCRYTIIRTCWLYSEYGHNFVKTMMRLTAEKAQINVVVDQIGTPTYAGDLAAVIMDFIGKVGEQRVLGTFNFSNLGVCSWYDFATAIAEIAGHADCRILPCMTSEYPTPAQRPAYSVLDKSKIAEVTGLKIPHWPVSLQRCISNLKNERV